MRPIFPNLSYNFISQRGLGAIIHKIELVHAHVKRRRTPSSRCFRFDIILRLSVYPLAPAKVAAISEHFGEFPFDVILDDVDPLSVSPICETVIFLEDPYI